MRDPIKQAYEHSGKLGLAPLVVPVAGIVGSLILALVYAYVTVYSPIAGFVSLLFVAGYGIGLAFVMALAGKLAKCRSASFMAVAGAAVGLIALYCGWAAFESVLLSKAAEPGEDLPGYVNLLLNPGAVWEICTRVNEVGWYSVSSATPTGLALWFLWGIEAVVVVGATTVGAIASISDEVFCETCDQWCEDTGIHLPLALPEDDAALIEEIALGDMQALEALEPAGGHPSLLTVEIKRCESCELTATYQLKRVDHTVDKDGKPEVETTDLSPQFLIPPQDVTRLEALAARPLPQPADEGEATA